MHILSIVVKRFNVELYTFSGVAKFRLALFRSTLQCHSMLIDKFNPLV